MASMIRSYGGQGRVVELGGVGGYLLGWLDPGQISAYDAVDIDADLHAGLRHDRIPVTFSHQPIETYTPATTPTADMAASEVLYFVEAPGAQLLRIWRTVARIDIALISCVLPRFDKPNWQRGYDRVEQAIEATGWPVIDRIRVESTDAGLAWEVTMLRPGSA
jgi:hypothetical protein